MEVHPAAIPAAPREDAVNPAGGTLDWSAALLSAVRAAATSQTDSAAYGRTGHFEPDNRT